jgi:hypothetical protein
MVTHERRVVDAASSLGGLVTTTFRLFVSPGQSVNSTLPVADLGAFAISGLVPMSTTTLSDVPLVIAKLPHLGSVFADWSLYPSLPAHHAENPSSILAFVKLLAVCRIRRVT